MNKKNKVLEKKRLTFKQMSELQKKADEGDGEANYRLGKQCYKDKDFSDAKEYFKKAKECGYDKDQKSSKYLDMIKNDEIKEILNDPQKAFELFTQINNADINQLQDKINNVIKIKENTQVSCSSDYLTLNPKLNELQNEIVELNDTLSGIKQTKEDVIELEEWKEHASVLVAETLEDIPSTINNHIIDIINQMDEDESDSSLFTDNETQSPTPFNTEQPYIEEISDDDANIFLSTIVGRSHDSLNQEEKDKLQKISEKLKNEMNKISSLSFGEDNSPLVILVGGTGSGKSTIAQWLIGKKLYSIPDPLFKHNNNNSNNRFIFSETSEDSVNTNSEISSGSISKTIVPKLWKDSNGIVYADCPGFNDTKGILQNIKNALYIQSLLKNRKHVKFLLVIPAIIFESSFNRGSEIVNAVKNLRNIFKDEMKLMNSISLVVTHHRKEIDNSLSIIQQQIKNHAEQNPSIKRLLNNLLENKGNKITLFSRPTEKGIYQNITSFTKQCQLEKSNLLSAIQKTKFIQLDYEKDVGISIPNDAKLILIDMDIILQNTIKSYLKNVSERVESHIQTTVENVKHKVDVQVNNNMKFYNPLTVVFGYSAKALESLGDLKEKAKEHISLKNTKLFKFSLGLTGVLGAFVSISALLSGISVAGGGVILSYYLSKYEWIKLMERHILEKEVVKISQELFNIGNIIQNGGLKYRKFNIKHLQASQDVSVLEKTLTTFECISNLLGNNFIINSKSIWDDSFLGLKEYIVKRLFQDQWDIYFKKDVPHKIKSFPEIGQVKLIQSIQLNDQLQHISKDFVENILNSYSDDIKNPINNSISRTGPHYTDNKLNKIISFMDYCHKIYTEDQTRTFVINNMIPTMKSFLSRIIIEKKEINRLVKLLDTILISWDDISKQQLIYESKGKNVKSSQVPSLSRKEQEPKVQENLDSCIQQINHSFSEIFKREFIITKDDRNLNKIEILSNKLKKIQQEISQEYGWYFKSAKSPLIPPFKDITDNNKELYLTDKAVVALSFLHKTGLSIDGNITVLDVSFRNLEDLEGIFNKIKEISLAFKKNKDALFNESGEVSKIAFIEKDIQNQVPIDQLSIVYSGSNSVKDWVADINFGKTESLNLSVHQGIGKLFNKSELYSLNLLIEKVIQYYKFNRIPSKLKIVVTGHSLGGALALLAAYHIKMIYIIKLCKVLNISKDKITVKTFTFGAPAILDEVSKQLVENNLGKKNINRIWSFNDPIVYLSIVEASHVGKSFILENISNSKFNILDDKLFGHHSAERYKLYLESLKANPLSKPHQELLSILTNHIKNVKLLAIDSFNKN